MINRKTPIRIFSPSIDLLGEIDDYTSLIFTRKYNELGEFSLHISIDKQNTEHLQENNFIMLDRDGNKAGIIKHREIYLDEKGNDILMVQGFTFDFLLDKNIVLLPQNENELIFTGKSGDLIEKLVKENIINAADPNRNISNLILEENNLGDDVIWKLEYKRLGETISELAKIHGIGYRITLDYINKKLVFNTYQGKDLTGDNLVVFSPKFNNIKSMKYIENSLEKRNVVYINNNGFVSPVGDVAGIDRVETYLNYGQLKETESLEEVGKNELQKHKRVESVDAEILPFNSFIYQKDYTLGDVVILQNEKWGLKKKLRITSVTEIYETENKVRCVFGEPVPSFEKKIKNMITNIK